MSSLLLRRGLMLSEEAKDTPEEPDTPQGEEMDAFLVAKFSFEGKTNNDTDRAIVYSSKGIGGVMRVVGTNWGAGDEYTKNGYYDGRFCTRYAGFHAQINIPVPLSRNNMTIIWNGLSYNKAGLTDSSYYALIGSVADQDTNTSPVYIDYQDPVGTFRSMAFGKSVVRYDTDGIKWMTPEYFCGYPLSLTQEVQQDRTISLLCIGTMRPSTSGMSRTSTKQLYIFNKTFTPSEIEGYIRRNIDSSYELPK